MVIIHVAHIDSAVIGGVQVAVPQMIMAQSQYARVGLINIHGDAVDGVQMIDHHGAFGKNGPPSPFEQPDLVVFHEVYKLQYIDIYKALNKARIPYIIIPHGCLSKQAQKRKWLKKLVANVLIFNRFLKSARAIQYLSENEAKLSAFSDLPAFICGNGIKLPQKRKSTFFEEGIRLVYIERLEIATKGLDILLGAIEQCGNLMRRARASVEIYGPNHKGELDALRKMADRLGVADLVILGTEKTGAEKEDILLRSDCFIQLSRTEALPMGPLEALSYGIPCILSEGVGLGDLVEGHGAGYRCETSVKSAASAVRRFIKQSEKAGEFSQAAVRLVEHKFNSDLIAEKTVEKYRQIVRN